jgi:hypothetical protein
MSPLAQHHIVSMVVRDMVVLVLVHQRRVLVLWLRIARCVYLGAPLFLRHILQPFV